MHFTEYCKAGDWGLGQGCFRMDSCFISMKKKPALKGTLSLFSWQYREENSVHTQAIPHLEAILPSKYFFCNVIFLTVVNLSLPTPMKMWTNSTVHLWDVAVLHDTVSFQNYKIKYSELPFHVSFFCNMFPLTVGRVQKGRRSYTWARWSPGWWGVCVVIAATSDWLNVWHFRKKPDSYFLSLHLKKLHITWQVLKLCISTAM